MAAKEKAKKRSQQKVSKLSKEQQDRKKYTYYLKTCGYNPRQLGLIKLSNLVILNETERKKQNDREAEQRYQVERALKAALDVGARVIHQESGKRIVRKGEKAKEKQFETGAKKKNAGNNTSQS